MRVRKKKEGPRKTVKKMKESGGKGKRRERDWGRRTTMTTTRTRKRRLEEEGGVKMSKKNKNSTCRVRYCAACLVNCIGCAPARPSGRRHIVFIIVTKQGGSVENRLRGLRGLGGLGRLRLLLGLVERRRDAALLPRYDWVLGFRISTLLF